VNHNVYKEVKVNGGKREIHLLVVVYIYFFIYVYRF